MRTIEASIVPRDFVSIVPEQPDLGGMRELTIKPGEILKLPIYKAGVRERGSERFRLKRGRRGRRSRQYCGRHPECRVRGRRCTVGLPRFSSELTI